MLCVDVRLPRLLLILGLMVAIIGCSGQESIITPGFTATVTTPASTATPEVYPSPSLTPSTTPIPPSITPSSTATLVPSPTLTPEPLPTFVPTRILRSGIEPTSYLPDACQYLRLRWGEGKSAPGTVVLPVMFHSIVQPPSKVSDPKDISAEEFQAFVQYAQFLGFETITMQELLNFMLHNDYIPPRSMILIVDDRRPGLIQEHFMPVLEENDWTVTAAYIADPFSLDWAWEWMERLNATGRLDVQSHGYSGQLYIVADTTDEQIQTEIWESTTVLEEHFGSRPVAFIWPGGNFTQHSVQIARQGGYQLGFSAYSRGPLMFNWVPLGEEERAVGDPLMVLPRAWSSSVNFNLDEALRIADQAGAFAGENQAAEKEWLLNYCTKQ